MSACAWCAFSNIHELRQAAAELLVNIPAIKLFCEFSDETVSHDHILLR